MNLGIIPPYAMITEMRVKYVVPNRELHSCKERFRHNLRGISMEAFSNI